MKRIIFLSNDKVTVPVAKKPISKEIKLLDGKRSVKFGK